MAANRLKKFQVLKQTIFFVLQQNNKIVIFRLNIQFPNFKYDEYCQNLKFKHLYKVVLIYFILNIFKFIHEKLVLNFITQINKKFYRIHK